MRLRRHISVICLTMSLCHCVAAPIRAESLTVSLGVGDTQFMAAGYTSPGAFVTIKQNGTVVATTTADSSGGFTHTLSSDPGIQNFSFYAADSDGVLTPTISYSVNLTPNTTTSLEHIVLPSTFVVETYPTHVGDYLSVHGQTHVQATVTLIVSDGSHPTTTPNSNGRWSLQFDTSPLSPGSYSTRATALLPGNYLSDSSVVADFTLLANPATETSAPPTTSMPSATPTASPCLPVFLRYFDINHNCRLDTSELEALIIRWLTAPLALCDLNHDQACSLPDFSILMYYIER